MNSEEQLQAAIRSNALKSVLLIAGFPFVLPTVTFIFLLVGLGIFGQRGATVIAGATFLSLLVVMVVATIVWLPIGYLIHQWVIDRATNARLLRRAEQPRLWAIFEALCSKCGMRMPALRIIETDALNAYASGLREGRYSVTVTRGLLDRLNDDELEGVLAHELTHIRNHDVRLLVVATVLVGTIPIVHDVGMKAFWFLVMGILGIYRAAFTLFPMPFARLLTELGYQAMFWAGKLFAYVIGFVGTMSSLVIHFALSRRREFMADAGAVQITGKPEAMISALRKISGNSTLDTAIEGVRAMMFDSAVFGFGGLFATHPPIEQRIEALSQVAQTARQKRAEFAAVVSSEASAPPSEPPRQDRAGGGSQSPPPDPAMVERYRQLLLRARVDAVGFEQRHQLYGRMQQTVENGKQLNAALSDLQVATARACLSEAIHQIEAAINGA